MLASALFSLAPGNFSQLAGGAGDSVAQALPTFDKSRAQRVGAPIAERDQRQFRRGARLAASLPAGAGAGRRRGGSSGAISSLC